MTLKTCRSAAVNNHFYQYCVTENLPVVVDLEKSRGSFLHTIDGQDILDVAGYYGSRLIGHNHPGLYEKGYVRRLVTAANNKVPNPDFMTRECLEFYKQAYALAPESMKSSPELEVYTLNSGAETVENMLKYLISRFNSRIGKSDRIGRRRFIVFNGSFHGRTVFALSMTQAANPVATRDFHPLFRSRLSVDFPAAVFSGFDPEAMNAYNDRVTSRALERLDRLARKHPGSITGIITEPVQGAGGHNMALPSFFREMISLAHDHEICTGFDEVQTGMGGTGRRYYVDHLDLPHPPQALAVAKKFGVGVLFMLDHLRDVGVLDSTWGGPLVDMVRAVQEIKIVEKEKLIQNAGTCGDLLNAGLRELENKYPDCICNARGLGYLQGFTVLPVNGSRARNLLLDIALKEHLLLMLAAGTHSIRLRPNLSTNREDVARFVDLLEASILDFRGKRPLRWKRMALEQRKTPAGFMKLL